MSRAQSAKSGALSVVLEKRGGAAESQAIFRLWDEIGGRTSYKFQKFTELVLLREVKECLVVINSMGGRLFDAISIVGNIALLGAGGVMVRTCVRGLAASGGALVFFAGNPRGMSAGSWLYVHDLSFFPTEDRVSLTDAHKEVRAHENIMRSVEERVSQNTGIPLWEVRRVFRASSWISAKRALSEGWCTDITP